MAQIDVGFTQPPAGRTGKSEAQAAAELGTLELLANATGQFQKQRLAGDVRETAEAASNYAQSVTDVQRELGTEDVQQGLSGFQEAGLAPGEQETEPGFLDLKGKAQEQARETFSKFSEAVRQGASSRVAARIAVEARMNEMISQNPGFADEIRQEAARAMGSTQFQFRTAGYQAPDGGPVTQLEKDLKEATVSVQERARLQGVTNPEVLSLWQRNARNLVLQEYQNNQAAEVAQSRELVGNERLEMLRQDAEFAANAASSKSYQLILETVGKDGQLKEEDVNNLRQGLQTQMAGALASFDQNVLKLREAKVDIDPKEVADARNRIQTAYQSKIEFLNNTPRVWEVLEIQRNRRQGLTQDAIEGALPLHTAISNMFGENANIFFELLGGRDSPARDALMTQLRNTGTWESYKAGPEGERTDEEVVDLFLKGLPRRIAAAQRRGGLGTELAGDVAYLDSVSTKAGNSRPEAADEAFDSLNDAMFGGDYSQEKAWGAMITATASMRSPDKEAIRRAKHIKRTYQQSMINEAIRIQEQVQSGHDFQVTTSGRILYSPPGMDKFFPRSKFGKGARLYGAAIEKFRANPAYEDTVGELPVSEETRAVVNYVKTNPDASREEIANGVRKIFGGQTVFTNESRGNNDSE